MALAKDYWEQLTGSPEDGVSALGTEIAQSAQSILGLPAEDRAAAYATAIEGKDANYVTALQISLYAYTPAEEGGLGANVDVWTGDTIGIQHFAAFQQSDSFKTSTGIDQPAVSMVSDVITVNAGGKVIQFDYGVDTSDNYDVEHGFRVWVDGQEISGDNIGDHPDVVAAIRENRDAIVGQMAPFLQERLRLRDGTVDEVTIADLRNADNGLSEGLDSGDMIALADALTIMAYEEAIKTFPTEGEQSLSAEVGASFLAENTNFQAAKEQATAVLTENEIRAEATPDPLAKDVFEAALQTTADAAAGIDEGAMPWQQFSDAFGNYNSSTGVFTGPVTGDEARAIAMYRALHDYDTTEGKWKTDPNFETMTPEEMEAHPDYVAVMTAHAAYSARPEVTVSAGADADALTVTATNMDVTDAAAVTAFVTDEANAAALTTQINGILSGDDAEITAEEATAALAKITTQLEGTTEGHLDHAILEMAKTRAEEVIASLETSGPDADAELRTETGVAAAAQSPIRDVQRFAYFAEQGEFAALSEAKIRPTDAENGRVSAIDGQPGPRTAMSMSLMLDKNFSELNNMTTEQAVVELQTRLETDEAFRNSVITGLRAAVGTDAEAEARAFLEARGVTVDAGMNAAIDAYATSLGAAEVSAEVTLSADAKVEITSADGTDRAFNLEVTGIDTVEQLNAYLAIGENAATLDEQIRAAVYNDPTVVNSSDGISAEEGAEVTSWIDAQLAGEGVTDVERTLLEHAKTLVDADVAAASADADNTIVVTAIHPALTDEDRVLDGDALQEAQEVLTRAGGDVPEAGILAIIEGGPMLVRQINGETVVTQVHENNFSEVLGEGVKLDAPLEGRLRERADMGDTSVEYKDVTIGLDPATANLLDTSTITIQQGDKEGLFSTFVAESTGRGVVIESEELADAVDYFDGRAADERLVTHFDLPGEFDSATVARGLEALERALDNNGAGSLSVEFVEGANGTTAEINYGDGQKLEIPKGLYDAIMEKATTEATRDHSQVLEVSAPAAGA